MAKSEPHRVMDETSTKVEQQSFELSVDEFCARLSATDKRVEMIRGFHFDEQRVGHIKDTEERFLARYEAFGKREVKN